MKKIFIIIFCILVVSGCNKEKAQPKKENIVKKFIPFEGTGTSENL